MHRGIKGCPGNAECRNPLPPRPILMYATRSMSVATFPFSSSLTDDQFAEWRLHVAQLFHGDFPGVERAGLGGDVDADLDELPAGR